MEIAFNTCTEAIAGPMKMYVTELPARSWGRRLSQKTIEEL